MKRFSQYWLIGTGIALVFMVSGCYTVVRTTYHGEPGMVRTVERGEEAVPAPEAPDEEIIEVYEDEYPADEEENDSEVGGLDRDRYVYGSGGDDYGYDDGADTIINNYYGSYYDPWRWDAWYGPYDPYWDYNYWPRYGWYPRSNLYFYDPWYYDPWYGGGYYGYGSYYPGWYDNYYGGYGYDHHYGGGGGGDYDRDDVTRNRREDRLAGVTNGVSVPRTVQGADNDATKASPSGSLTRSVRRNTARTGDTQGENTKASTGTTTRKTGSQSVTTQRSGKTTSSTTKTRRSTTIRRTVRRSSVIPSNENTAKPGHPVTIERRLSPSRNTSTGETRRSGTSGNSTQTRTQTRTNSGSTGKSTGSSGSSSGSSGSSSSGSRSSGSSYSGGSRSSGGSSGGSSSGSRSGGSSRSSGGSSSGSSSGGRRR